jgi:hypothetical protein
VDPSEMSIIWDALLSCGKKTDKLNKFSGQICQFPGQNLYRIWSLSALSVICTFMKENAAKFVAANSNPNNKYCHQDAYLTSFP